MAETNPSDKGDRQNLEQIENAAPSTSDILQARNVSSEQVEAAWAANPDRSDGSATPRNRSLLAKQGESLRDFVDKQNASIELTERDEFALCSSEVMSCGLSCLAHVEVITYCQRRRSQ